MQNRLNRQIPTTEPVERPPTFLSTHRKLTGQQIRSDRKGLHRVDAVHGPHPRVVEPFDATGADPVLVGRRARSADLRQAAETAFAAFAAFAQAWGPKYPAIVKLWHGAWEEFSPFLAFPPEIRRLIYTTNTIESLNARLRQATRRRGHFPDPDAALKVLYLVIQDHKPNRKNIDGKTVGWKAVINTLTGPVFSPGFECLAPFVEALVAAGNQVEPDLRTDAPFRPSQGGYYCPLRDPIDFEVVRSLPRGETIYFGEYDDSIFCGHCWSQILGGDHLRRIQEEWRAHGST